MPLITGYVPDQDVSRQTEFGFVPPRPTTPGDRIRPNLLGTDAEQRKEIRALRGLHQLRRDGCRPRVAVVEERRQGSEQDRAMNEADA
jgi:hypothetical protein